MDELTRKVAACLIAPKTGDRVKYVSKEYRWNNEILTDKLAVYNTVLNEVGTIVQILWVWESNVPETLIEVEFDGVPISEPIKLRFTVDQLEWMT